MIRFPVFQNPIGSVYRKNSFIRMLQLIAAEWHARLAFHLDFEARLDPKPSLAVKEEILNVAMLRNSRSCPIVAQLALGISFA
jgi:hypothetical protein